MPFEVKSETLSSLSGYYNSPDAIYRKAHLFSLPLWLKAWWEAFGANRDLMLRSVWQDGQLIGVAPLMCEGGVGRLLGSPDVCDYLEFNIAPGKEREFFNALIPELQKEGIGKLDLNAQRSDSAVFSTLFAGERQVGISANFSREDEAFELTLPSSWEGYLAGLKKKQRHEVRRKLRRLLDEGGDFQFRVIEDPEAVVNYLPDFFELFRQHPEKDDFLNAGMEQYFHILVKATAQAGLARFGLLEVGEVISAAVLYFDYQGRIYLYNSGYHSGYGDLSAGLLSKVLCIKENIERRRTIFDFLKGKEIYKRRLGAAAIPIYKVELTIGK